MTKDQITTKVNYSMYKVFRHLVSVFFMVFVFSALAIEIVYAASLVIDNGDTASNWVSSDATNTTVSQETTIKQEGTGSVKIQTTAEASTTLDLMEYSSDGTAQAGYVSNNTGLDDSNSKALLHMNGADASTTFTDESGKTWTVAGDAQIDTAQSKFGGASGLFDGSVDYLTSPDSDDWQLDGGSNSNKWTIDGWLRTNGAVSTAFGLFEQYVNNTNFWGVRLTTVPQINIIVKSGSSTPIVNLSFAISISTDTWFHFAMVKDGTNGYGVFIDGTQVGAWQTDTDPMPNLAGLMYTGYFNDGTPTYWKGWIDEMRISKGVARWTTNFTPPTLPYESLRAYSEATIKTQGTYALKGVANQTTSLNKTLTRTIGSPVNLSNINSATFDIRSTRTGSNIKVGLRDSGGTTTEVTPNITSANTYQSVTVDLSGVTNANKDAIDQIIITIVNADATNTFYLDNMVAAYGSLNDTVTLTKSSTDLSSYTAILYWVRSTVAGSFARLQFGESASTEQTSAFTINTPDTWEQKTWDISGITGTARDAVTKLALQFTSDTSGAAVYLDNILTNTLPATPSLDLPADSATNQLLSTVLKTTTTDTDADYLRYKIQTCTDVGMTTSCQTFDQTSSQVGWTGQDTQTSSAYTSGTQATYTLQTPLSNSTTYYWRSYAKDPAGSNTWSATQGTPYSFTTHEGDAPTISSITSVAGDTASTYYDNTDDSSTAIVLVSTDGAGGGVATCKWDSSDVAYDSMANSCASTSSCTTTLSGDGVKTVYIRCQDVYGNKMASSQSVSYTIDATAPTTLSATGSSASWTSAKPTVTVSTPTDALSGMNEIRYVWDTNDLGADCSAGTTTTATAALTGTLTAGSHILYLCASDLAGNVATWNGAYKWDNGNPIVNITTHVVSLYNLANIPAKIEGTASDVISAIASVAVSIYNGVNYWTGEAFDSLSQTWMAATGTTTWEYTFAPSTSGDYTLQSRAIDSAANQTLSSTTLFSYDSIAPTISTAESVAVSSSGGTITWTTGEASSTQVQYGVSSSYGTTTSETDTSPRVTSHSVVLSSLTSCSTYHYRIISKDAAGNTLTGSDKTFTTTGCAGSATVQAETAGTITTASGGEVQLTESSVTKVTLTIPANFTGSDAEFQVKRLDKTSVILVTSTPTAAKTAIGDHVYQLDALTSVTEKATSFDEPITVTMTYTDAEIVGYDETALLIYRWDGAAWYQLTGCTVDTAANTVTCTTTAFSTFVLFGQAPASSSSSTPFNGTQAGASCTDISPKGKLPWLYGAIPQNSTSIKLYFTDADGQLTHYMLEYGTKKNIYQHGVLNIGGKGNGFKQYTVQNLKPNTKYYFRVSAVNGCAAGQWSEVKEVLTSTLTTTVAKTETETEAEATTPISCQTYTVQKGDTLWKIAKEKFDNPYRYGDLIAANQEEYPSLVTTPNLIEIGWKLKNGICNEEQTSNTISPTTTPVVWYLDIWNNIKDLLSKKLKW